MHRPQLTNFNNQQKSSINTSSTHKKASKELRILDYRNGKYQGFASSQGLKRNGIGILLDDNYSFVLSQWSENRIQGPFFMVYPDESILYGYIEKEYIGEVVCYHVQGEFNMLLSKNKNIIIVDLLKSNTIFTFKIDSKFLNQHSSQSISKIISERQQVRQGIQLLSQNSYSTIDQKQKIYQKNLSLSNVPQQLKSYESFIKAKFNSTQNTKELIQFVKTRQDLTINYKKSALTLFIKLFLDSSAIKMIGSMNRYQNYFEYYKKILHSTKVTQQVVKSKKQFIVQYPSNQNSRPKTCSTQLSQLHRSSVMFINEFINLNYMYQIKEYLQKINQLIVFYITNKLAQVQLENSNYVAEEEQHFEANNNRKNTFINYSLSEVQQDIYDAVKRKQMNSGKKLNLTGNSIRKSPIPNSSFDHVIQAENKNYENKFKYNNSPYIDIIRNNVIPQNRLKKSNTTLNLSRKYDQRPTESKKNPPLSKSNTKKYTYLDDQQNQPITTAKQRKSTVQYYGDQNIRRLTEDYENIKKQIELSTPKGKNKTGYKLDNSAYRNYAKNQNTYAQHNRTYEYTGNKYAPISQRKVFKYLPN